MVERRPCVDTAFWQFCRMGLFQIYNPRLNTRLRYEKTVYLLGYSFHCLGLILYWVVGVYHGELFGVGLSLV